MERIVLTTCNSHCGGACLLRVHVSGGRITRIETDNGEPPQFRACLRGRSLRQRVYHPDRLLYPLRRIGIRGEGRFERVTWDEAIDTIAKELVRVRDTYGPESILFMCSGGDLHALHHGHLMERLLSLLGGFTERWGSVSYEGAIFAELATYGTTATANTRDDLLSSRLVILWGWDPAVTISSTGTMWYLARAREKGTAVISVDPRYTSTAATVAQEWIPIRPGTDAAMLIAMAYVTAVEGLHDRRFLDTYTVGFDRYRDYLLGTGDGLAKTPEWAEGITGVPAETIARLARLYATTKPAALMAGIGPGRTAYGEQYHRAAHALAAMTGNVGISGGNAAARTWGGEYWGGEVPFGVAAKGRMPSASNPVGRGAPARPGTLPARGAGPNSTARVHAAKLADALLRGKKGGYPADFKLLYMAHANYLNQMANTNRLAKALESLEFIVVQEQFMTASARYADIILPTCTFLERNDFTTGGATPFFGCVNQAIQPQGESRSPFQIASVLAERLGLAGFSDKCETDWVNSIAAGYRQTFGAPDLTGLQETGIYKVRESRPYVAFQKQIEEPSENPFPTPSGKIEIYSEQLASMNDPRLPPIPTYIEPWESPRDPLGAMYPLQLITSRSRRRAHSQFDNLAWLAELQKQALLINRRDAKARGISDGDAVKVFNDRGQTVVSARVTERIMPGVVDLPEGAWFKPDAQGLDRGGCCNVLTRDELSPGGAFCSNTCLVQVEKLD